MLHKVNFLNATHCSLVTDNSKLLVLVKHTQYFQLEHKEQNLNKLPT